MQIRNQAPAAYTDATQHSQGKSDTTPVGNSVQGQNAEGGKSTDEIENSVEHLQKQLDQLHDTQVQLQYDKEIDRVIVKYVSQGTGEVVRQIPTEKFVEFQKEFVRTIGLLFDQKV